MAKIKKVSAVLWLLCGILCLCMMLSACDEAEPTVPTTTTTTQPTEAIFEIRVKTAGGLPLEGVGYHIYDSDETVVGFGQLTSEGLISFPGTRGEKYSLKLLRVPQGYAVKEIYEITEVQTEIVLTASVITEGNATDRVYKLGDVITDFTVTDAEGNSYTISEILKTKDAVVLNFWYIGCNPCKKEFPYLQKAYELYSDKLEVIAMNPMMGETEADVAAFKEENGYTFPMVKVDAAWNAALGDPSFPCTLIVDRYGVICLMEIGGVTEEGIFEGAFNHFTAENYEQKLVQSMEELDNMDYEEGHKRNPMETNGSVKSFQATVKGGQSFFCNIARCDGIIFKVQSSEIYVMYDNKRYDANAEGLISFELSCPSTNDVAKLEFINKSDSDQTITVELEIPKGSYSNPFDLTYGEVEVAIKAGNDQGLFYTMVADKSGYVMLTVTGLTGGQQYEIQIDNRGSKLTTLFSESCKADENGNLAVAIPVSAGDELCIAFMSVPNGSSYPAVTIQALVSYSEHGGIGALKEIEYTLTFKDVEGLPMAGITATFTVDGEAVVLVSDEEGIITTLLPEGSYMVQLVFPEGFTADATQYLLTAYDASKEIVVRLYEEKEVSYTIHVQDNDGLPVAGVVITVGNSYMLTDENGNAVFMLPVGNYQAFIFPPQGYTAKQESYSFGTRPEVVIVLENAESVSRTAYTVTVLDGFGKPYSNVVVRLYAADGTAYMLIVENGVATGMLLRGDYTVELVFQQEDMQYEKKNLQLTAEVTSTTIVVARAVSGKPVKVSPTTTPGSTFQAYYLQLGNTYVEVEPMAINYFLFKPTEIGTYKIYANKPGAKIENWNTLAQTTPLTSGVEENVFTLEVTELGQTYAIGINAAYDTDNSILTIIRVPDCVQETYPIVNDLPVVPYLPHLPDYAEIRYPDFMGPLPMVMGADGLYHWDNPDGPVVLVDLMGSRFGVSIMEIINSGEMAWYRYDEYGYPIYRKDYTEALALYLLAMEPTKGLYPLTDHLRALIQEYGNSVGWWDPQSENYLFADMDDEMLMSEYAWMFLTCYIYIDPALCQHEFDQWIINGENTVLTHTCIHCKTVETHTIGVDCNMSTAGHWTMNFTDGTYVTFCLACSSEMVHRITLDCNDDTCAAWELSNNGSYYERLCHVCHSLHRHNIGTDCQDADYGPWMLSEDGLGYERTCTVCGAKQHHITGTDCQDADYDPWMLCEDGLGYERACAVCGAKQYHTTGTDCQDADYGPWMPSEDGLSFERACAVCGTKQYHTTGTDCREGDYSQWAPTEDGLGYERACAICGTKQHHTTGADCKDETCNQWEVSEDGLRYVRTCQICATVFTHVNGTDCENHYGLWEKSEEDSAFVRTCAICGTKQTHTVGTDCESHYSQWEKAGDGLTATRACAICGNTQTHTVGTDCESHYSQWEKAGDGLTATRACTICGNTQTHTVGTDCESHYSQWEKAGDGLTATRACAICGNTQTHTIGTDCESNYSQWEKADDGLTATRACAICGNTQTHTIGTDCENNYSQWEKADDGLTATRACAICGNTQTHTVGTDCESHYGQWTDCDDGVNQQCVCAICGNVQTRPIQQEPVTPPEEPDPVPEPEPQPDAPAEG